MAVSIVANSDTFQTTTPSDREICMTRLFNAPRQLVFDALTKSEHVRQWWGVLSDEYSVAVCEIDLRPGGAWRFAGRGPDGQAPEFYGLYREITPPERLVYTEIFAPYPDVESVVTTVLADENGKTRLTITASYPSLEVRDMVINTGMSEGAAISYDRLEELVGRLQTS